ncbi:ABC transporter permease [Microtetraspora sp. NBRC 16547]|uniref:ABC transporter permease n=1 Tax=Microtetraspora sp. NBRC 16547 TaxID=3030993 RepID=UPI0024A59AA8|nr:ABC transporter permease [Microtetraspora sp. NBRC 16547]GLX01064.1 transport permease protein [Microtetraspora sp. NBRC 16547]
MMPIQKKLILTETKLFLREPAAVFFVVVLPAALLLVLGASIPGFRDADPSLGGERVIDTQLPGMMVLLSIVTLALSSLPSTLVAYREKGVLRRMSTTPIRPTALLVAQIAISAVVAVLSTALTLTLGHLVLGVPVPRQLAAFAGVLVLGAVAMFSIGLWLAAVAPNTRVVQGAGAVVMFPLLFLGGMWLPRDLMPSALRVVSDFTPTGAFGQVLRDTMAGHAPGLPHLAVLAGWALIAGIAAARMFRWE